MSIFPYKGIWPTVADDAFIAPGAVVVGDVTVEAGASIWYNAVVRGDSAPIVIGARTNVQDNATLHVDGDAPLSIGEECTIGHNAVVHGATVGNRVLVGMNAVILSHARVGSDVIVGASALVNEHKQIPDKVLVVGVPARVSRPLKESEVEHLRESAEGYFQRAQEHKESQGS